MRARPCGTASAVVLLLCGLASGCGSGAAGSNPEPNSASGPAITGLSTSAGAAGTPVVIEGVNFGAGKGSVAFGSTTATVNAWSPTSISTTVPDLAPGSAKVTVTPSDGASAAAGFTVLAGQNVCAADGTVSIGGDAAMYEQDEWNSNLQQCSTVNGNSFLVTAAGFNLSTSGAPATFPSIFIGCDWGRCTSTAESNLPLEAGKVASAVVNVSTQSASGGAYNTAWNLWFNRTPDTAGQPDGAQVMVWLNSAGGVEPWGTKTATVTLAGASWDVWTGTESSGGTTWKIVSYVNTKGTESASQLDLENFVADATSRGIVDESWYLIEVQMGFEIWQGGAGLAANNVSMAVESK